MKQSMRLGNGLSLTASGQLAAIHITRRFSVPSERVFSAWLEPVVAGQWLFATALRPMTEVDIDARVGGAFRFAEQRYGELTERTGKYIEIVPPRRLVFTLSMAERPRASTRVTVAISPLEAGCALTLTHEQVPLECASYLEGRWTGILYGLGAVLASTAGRNRSDRLNPSRGNRLSISLSTVRPVRT